MVTVLTVDDHASFRVAAHAVVAATDGFEEIGQACTAELAITAADRLRPDMILMDIGLPDMNGCEASRRIVASHPGVVVVLITSARELVPASDAAMCSAVAVIGKELLGPSVLRGIWEDHCGER